MQRKANIFTKNGKSLVSKVRCTENLEKDIEKSVSLIGGFKKLVKKGDNVLVKPNYVFNAPFPATTAPDFLKAAIHLLQRYGASRVIIGESSVYWLNTKRVMKAQGAFGVAAETGAEVHIFDEHEYIKKEIPNARYKSSSRIPKILDEVDKLVFLPCLKTHGSARFTASLKLALGCTKKTERIAHFIHLEPKIAEVSSIIWPDICIMDARKIFVTHGPEEGDIEDPNLLLASGDRIALDVEGVKIIQGYNANNRLRNINPWELPTIVRAIELGLGASSEKDYFVVEQ